MSDDMGGDSSFKHIAQWFFLIAGVIYGTGYLVILTYLDTFGIHESAADYLKLRYMHVGLLCIIPLAIGVAFFYAFVLLKRSRRSAAANHAEAMTPAQPPTSPPTEAVLQQAQTVATNVTHSEKPAPSFIGAMLLLNVLFVFYFAIVFLPMGFIGKRFYYMLGLFLGTIVGMLVINDYALLLRWKLIPSLLKALKVSDKATIDRLREDAHKRGAKKDVMIGKCVLLVGMIGVGIGLCLWGYWSKVGHVLWPAGIFYVLTFSTIIILNGLFHFRAVNYPRPDGRRGMIAARICLIGPLYVLFVLAFARGVFPWIPTSKGGANFRDVPPMVLVLNKEIRGRLPPKLFSEDGVVVLEVNAETVYVADFDSYHAWESKWQENPLHSPDRPFVWSIDRKQILAIRYGTTVAKSSE